MLLRKRIEFRNVVAPSDWLIDVAKKRNSKKENFVKQIMLLIIKNLNQ